MKNLNSTTNNNRINTQKKQSTMKNLMYVMAILCLILSSCQKEESVEVIENAQTSHLVAAKNIDGILHFEDTESFFSEFKKVAAMNEIELNAWEDEIGFNSIRYQEYKALEELNSMPETAANFESFKAEYDDLFEFTKDGMNSKNQNLYSNIIGSQGMYYVGSTLHKVLDNHIIAITDGDMDKMAKAEYSLQSNEADGIYVNSYNVNLQEQTELKNDLYCGTYLSDTEVSSGRSILLEVWLDQAMSMNAGVTTTSGVVNIKIRPKRFGILGWTRYKTTLEYKELEFEVSNCVGDFIGGPYSGDSNGDDYYTLSSQFWFGDAYQTSPCSTNDMYGIAGYFTRVKALASSRGIGDNWAEVRCNYLPDNPSTPTLPQGSIGDECLSASDCPNDGVFYKCVNGNCIEL